MDKNTSDKNNFSHDDTDYIIEQMRYKILANANSETIKKIGKLDLLKEYNMMSLYEYMVRLNNGENMSKTPTEKALDDFIGKRIVVPENLDGEEITMYEADNQFVENALMDEKNVESAKRLLEYTVISLEFAGKEMSHLIIDSEGKDVGRIIYSETGKPSFEMSKQLIRDIESRLKNVPMLENYLSDEVRSKEFYFSRNKKNPEMDHSLEDFVRAIEEDKLLPSDNINELIARVEGARNILEKSYTDKDAKYAVILTPEERFLEEDKNKAEFREEDDRAINEELRENEIEEEENGIGEKTKILISQTKGEKNTDEKGEKEEADKEKDDDEKSSERLIYKEEKLDKEKEKEKTEKELGNSLSKKQKEEIIKNYGDSEKSKEYPISELKTVFTVKSPTEISDYTKNLGVRRQGEPVTVLRFANTVGQNRYLVLQDNRVLGGEMHDEALRNLFDDVIKSGITLKRVEDNKSTLDYNDSSEKEKQMKMKRVPVDMTHDDKEAFRQRLEIALKELQKARKNNPYSVEVDKKEREVCNMFKEVGLIPPETIKEDADRIDAKETNNKNIDLDDDYFDEVGRLKRNH